MSSRTPRAAAVLALLVGLLTGWGAATASDWNGPCQPRFPGVEHLVDSLPSYACFTVGEGDAAGGYTLDVSYSGQQHESEESLKEALAEARVFWEQFPYRVYDIHIDTTAAFGESAIEKMSVTGDELQTRFGGRPDSLVLAGDFPDQPTGRTEIALWVACGVATASSVLLFRRSRRVR